MRLGLRGIVQRGEVPDRTVSSSSRSFSRSGRPVPSASRRSGTVRGPFGPAVSFNIRTRDGRDKTLYVSVDETGNVGDPDRHDYFVLVACVVSDYSGYTEPMIATRERERWTNPNLMEVKFHNSPSHRERMIRDIQDSIDYIVYFAVRNTDATKPAKHMMAARSLQRIADFILEFERGDLYVEIDHTNMIGDQLAEAIFERNPLRGDRTVNAESCESRERVGLQSHDFITGGIGRLYNSADPTYYAMMTPVVISLMTHDEWDHLFTDPIADELRGEDPSGRIDHWEDWYNNPERYTVKGTKKKRDKGNTSHCEVILEPTEYTLPSDYLKPSGTDGPKRDAKGRFVSNGGSGRRKGTGPSGSEDGSGRRNDPRGVA